MQYFWLTLTILLIGLLFHLWKRPRNFPPGPWSVPVIGHFLQLDYRYPIPDFAKLAKRYGNIFRIYLGSTPIILTHGFEAVKEVLVNHGVEFSHRPKHPAFNIICNTKGIVMAPAGQHWKEQRRFSIMVMRNFGMGKKSMEARIQEEIEHLVRAFEVQEDTPFDPRELINRAVGNIICSVLFGHRFNYEDNSFGQLIHPINENFKLAFGMWGEIYNTLPFLRCLPLPFQKIFKNMKVIHAFLKKEIEEHRETWTPDEPRDYIDSYLDEIEKRKNGKSCFNEDSLLYCLTDLLVAATDTTTSALTWILLMMMTYPDIQAKCYREIRSLQQNKTDGFCYQGRCKFPFIHAVLHEVLRLKEIVSLVPRSVTQEITIHGYTIPKDTRVMADLSSALQDESQWKYPHEFNPSNFLNVRGEFVKPEAFMSFGAGPRICLGENLARMELFLIFINLLKKFEFIWPECNTPPDLSPTFGTVNSPQSFKMQLRQREA